MVHLNDSAVCFFPWIELYSSSFFVLYSRQVININILFFVLFIDFGGGGTRGEGSVVACGHATHIGRLAGVFSSLH